MVPASAVHIPDGNNAEQVDSNNIFLEKADDGTFFTSSGENCFKAVKCNEDIVCNNAGQYFTQVSDNRYVSTEKIDISIDDYKTNPDLLKDKNIPSSSIELIDRVINEQDELQNNELIVSLYCTEPYQILNSSTNQLAKANQSVVETYTVEVRNYYSAYKYVKTGTTTKTVAASLFNLILSSAGAASTSPVSVPASIFGVGISALSAYQTFTNRTVSVGKPSDYMQISFKLDYLEKTSSVVTPAGNLKGCVSKKLWLDKVNYIMVFASANSVKYNKWLTINKSYKSKHWDDSAKTALYNYHSTVVDPDIVVKVGGLSYRFGN